MRFQCFIPVLSLFLAGTLATNGQLQGSQADKIDSLFMPWDAPNHPGGAVGVMKDGKVVYSKAFGLASLEYQVPNTPTTVFNTGSVSKQFTAMGIVLMEEAGQLSFDEDIRTYLPGLPDFGHKITLRHLMHHTSGLRSLHALFGLAGWRSDDSRTNDDLNRLILKQKDLNFEPGDEYLYCNTGYMLMASIIERTSGKKFPAWMKENVFDPLGMDNTYVEDRYNRVVPNNATSYYAGEEFDRAVEYWGYVGSGNMHSTIGDLLEWGANFYDPAEGWKSAFETLQTLDPLNDGTPLEYAFGVVVDTHLGEKRVGHGGSIGGFRAYIATYPDQQMNVALLTNFSNSNPGGKAAQVAELVLGKEEEEAPGGKATTVLASEVLRSYEGTYWDSREKLLREISLFNDTLRYRRSETDESPLLPQAKDRFLLAGTGTSGMVTFKRQGELFEMRLSMTDELPSVFVEKDVTRPEAGEAGKYAGTYYSPEVETAYTISIENGDFMGYHPRHGYLPLEWEAKDLFSAEWPLGTIEVHRDDAGNIDGLLISNGRVRNLWFARQ